MDDRGGLVPPSAAVGSVLQIMLARDAETSQYAFARTVVPSAVVHRSVIGHFSGNETTDVVIAGENALTAYRYTPDTALAQLAREPVFNAVTDVQVLSGIHLQFTGDGPRVCPAAAHNLSGKQELRDLILFLADSGVLTILTLRPAKPLSHVFAPDDLPLASHSLVPEPAPALEFCILKEIVVSSPSLDPFNRNHTLAVDPMSRAIAISALKNSFQIFLIHNDCYNRHFQDAAFDHSTGGLPFNPTTTNSQASPSFASTNLMDLDPPLASAASLDAGDPRWPDIIQESRIFTVSGTIVNVAFLHPRPTEHDRVLLALTLMSDASPPSLSLYIYEFWLKPREDASVQDGRAALDPSILKRTRYYARLPFAADASFPHHMVALANHPESLLLITEQTILWIDAEGAASGNVHHARLELPISHETGMPVVVTGISQALLENDGPATAMVNSSASPSATSRLYMGTAHDGLIQLTISGDRESSLASIPFNSAIGSALQILMSNSAGGDVVFVPQDMGDHYVVLIRPDAPMSVMQRLPSLASIIGCTTVAAATVWLACGRDPCATLRELSFRHAVQRRVDFGTGFAGVTNIWHLGVVDGEAHPETLADATPSWLVMTSATASRLLKWQHKELTELSAVAAFNASSPTVLAGMFQARWLVQVLPTQVAWIDLDAQASSTTITWQPPTNSAYRITHAVLLDTKLIVTTVDDQGCTLHAIAFDPNPALPWTPQPRHHVATGLGSECSCLYACLVDGQIHCVVGTYAPGLVHYRLLQDEWQLGTNRLVGELLGLHDGHSTAVPHAINLYTAPNQVRYLVVGLRDGRLLVCLVAVGEQSLFHLGFNPQHTRVLSVGDQPVSLATSSTMPPTNLKPSNLSTTLLVQSNSAYQLYANVAGPFLVPVALPSTCGAPVVISSLHQWRSNAPAQWLLVAQDHLWALQISPSRRLERTFDLSITPKHVQVDPLTGHIVVVGYNVAADLDQVLVIDAETGFTVARQSLLPKEQIYSLMTWTLGDRPDYRYFCIGTGRPDGPHADQTSESSGAGASSSPSMPRRPGAAGLPPKGRVIMYNLKRLGQSPSPSSMASPDPWASPRVASSTAVNDCDPVALSPAQLELRFVWDMERVGTVTRLAAYGRHGLLVAAGTRIALFELDVAAKKLTEKASFDVGAPIRALSVSHPFVSVAPVLGPLALWQYDPSTRDFTFVKSTRCTAHISRTLLLADDMLLASGQFGGLVGYTQQPQLMGSTATAPGTETGASLAQPSPRTWISDTMGNDIDGATVAYTLSESLAFSTQDTIRHLEKTCLSQLSWLSFNLASWETANANGRPEENSAATTTTSPLPAPPTNDRWVQDASGASDRAWSSHPLPTITQPNAIIAASLAGTIYGLVALRYPLYHVLSVLQHTVSTRPIPPPPSSTATASLAGYRRLLCRPGSPDGSRLIYSFPGIQFSLGGTSPPTPSVVYGDFLAQWYHKFTRIERARFVTYYPELQDVAQAYLMYCSRRNYMPSTLFAHEAINDPMDPWSFDSDAWADQFLHLLDYALAELNLALGG